MTFHNLYTFFEVKMGACAACAWALFNFILGGIDTPIIGLACLMCLDFITGIISGYKRGHLDSAIGSKGLMKKAGVLVCILIAYLLDTAMGIECFKGMVISGFALIEAISIVENIDRMGYGEFIPSFLRENILQIAQSRYRIDEEKDELPDIHVHTRKKENK